MIVINTSASLKAGLQLRPAVSSDQQKISDLILFSSHVHRHLDWRTPLDWLGYPPYWVLEEGGHLVGALACPPDPDSISWIRLFVFASNLSGSSVWPRLWNAARDELAEAGGATVAVIATQRWFDSILIESGFDLNGHITLLEWNEQTVIPTPIPPNTKLRAMTWMICRAWLKWIRAAFELPLAQLIGGLEQGFFAGVLRFDRGRCLGYGWISAFDRSPAWGSPGPIGRPARSTGPRVGSGAGRRPYSTNAKQRGLALNGQYPGE